MPELASKGEGEADGDAPAHVALASARTRGAHLRDPVRLHFAEALARRASAHAGEARRLIEARVAAIAQALSDRPEAESTAGPAAPAAGRGALAALVAHAARHRTAPPPVTPRAPSGAAQPSTVPQPAVTGAAADAKTVQFFKRTWSRLCADQRLGQSRASLPENAGPLNSQHLVHRALVLMRELSPEYLEHFVGYIDALQWVEQSNEAAQEAAGAGRPVQARRSAAARRG